jgi:hypothetical protein
MVVITHPPQNTLPRLLEAHELRTPKKLPKYRLPEPLYLTQRHGMMRAGPDMLYSVLLQFPLKPALATPVNVLPPVVHQHLLRRPVLTGGTPVYLDHALLGLAPKQVQSRHVPRIIVYVPDQIRVPTPEPEREYVALPHLVWRRPLEKPRMPGVAVLPARRWTHQLRLAQRFAHRLRRCPKKKHAAQYL